MQLVYQILILFPDGNFELFSEREQQDTESHTEEDEDEEQMQDNEEFYIEYVWRSDHFKPKLFKFVSSDSGINST